MSRARAVGLAAALAWLSVPAAAAPSLTEDFNQMSQWLTHHLAQGLAFNAGSTFDPPRVVKGYALQPDLSLGIGKIPFPKGDFPALTTPALQTQGGPNLFPNQVLFPNLALHLRMGLPWKGDVYFRFADATTPAGYKISPTMTAKVQTNSYGAGLRQQFFGAEDQPALTLGAHYNHVKGTTHIAGKIPIDANGLQADSTFTGDIQWNLNSYGLTAVLSQSFGAWTPFFGAGYNYATGSVRTRLSLLCDGTFLCTDVLAERSDHPEESQGRWIFGVDYARPSWSFFANGEVKAIGESKYQTYIMQAGVALPFEIDFRKGHGFMPLHRKKDDQGRRLDSIPDERAEPQPAPRAAPKGRAPRKDELPPPRPKTKGEKAPPDMIFLQ